MSYAIYIELITSVGMRAHNHPPLEHTLVKGVRVDFLEETINKFLFGLKFVGSTTTIEFDYQLRVVKSRRMMRDP